MPPKCMFIYIYIYIARLCDLPRKCMSSYIHLAGLSLQLSAMHDLYIYIYTSADVAVATQNSTISV